MEDCPHALLAGLTGADHDAVQGWWSNLDGEHRRELLDCWNPRCDDPSFGFFADCGDADRPDVRTRPFLAPWGPSAADADLRDEWYEEFREFLIENPGLKLSSMFEEIHTLNHPSDTCYAGVTVTRWFGPEIVTEHHWVDWGRIRRAPWLVPPPSECDD